MARLGEGVALALLAVAVGTGVQAHALGARRTSSERAPSSQLLAQAQAGKRSALVIGNGAYTDNRLDNAVNDAEAVARTLQEIGFSVTLVRNADRRAIDEAVEAFSRRLGPGEIGLFFFRAMACRWMARIILYRSMPNSVVRAMLNTTLYRSAR